MSRNHPCSHAYCVTITIPKIHNKPQGPKTDEQILKQHDIHTQWNTAYPQRVCGGLDERRTFELTGVRKAQKVPQNSPTCVS